MSEWKDYYLGDVVDYKKGFAFKSNWYQRKGRYIVRVSDTTLNSINIASCNCISEELASQFEIYSLLKDDVIIATVGSWPNNPSSVVGKVVKVPNEANGALLNQNAVRLRGNEKIDNKFLYYLLKSNQFSRYIVSKAQGSANQASITLKDIIHYSFKAPELEEQSLIANFLYALDDKIAVNRRICENLEAQAQALFKHWFIDFAPFLDKPSGKAERKNGKFVESELGMIPEGWRVGTLDEYVDNLSGYSYKGNELQPSTTAMATIKNFVRGGGFKIEGYKEIVISKNIKEYQYVNLFDVLVAHTDLTQNAEVVGNPAIILSTAGYEKLIMSMDLTKVVSKDARITPPLLHSILSTRKFKEHALGYVNGTTVLHMSKKAVPEYKLVMPKNLDILKELTSVLDNLYSLMSETYAENLRLSTLRDTLLPKLMSGQIKV